VPSSVGLRAHPSNLSISNLNISIVLVKKGKKGILKKVRNTMMLIGQYH
jgi:hypothetical protein